MKLTSKMTSSLLKLWSTEMMDGWKTDGRMGGWTDRRFPSSHGRRKKGGRKSKRNGSFSSFLITTPTPDRRDLSNQPSRKTQSYLNFVIQINVHFEYCVFLKNRKLTVHSG